MGRFLRTRDRTDYDHREGVILGLEGAHPSTPISCEFHVSVPQEEAFGIWEEWASYYPPDSQERKLLDGIRQRRWLVSIVHHDYKNPDALWTFLFDDGPGA